ncbi:hypothetical protein GSU68_16865 [Rathayibacter sp. VKM Ac-2759]|uniref:hypothetical protein n=1 Tax=Rathayibacter sp. VKM Ac-2759 TaxID=2609252 RepID=UPI0013195BFD|nr:hypothetical protein [Rathayibacter sp. VKM Ac-2759]QHC68074.1 hypothetical protein GSU68_16865 [Rathayibacter sp. VKM Ac-2759]
MDENDIAAEHLRAELRLRRFSGLRMAIDAALGGGVVTVHDLVVTRLDTGAEVLRTKADIGDPHHLLGQVELDLETRTTAEFLREWNAT